MDTEKRMRSGRADGVCLRNITGIHPEAACEQMTEGPVRKIISDTNAKQRQPSGLKQNRPTTKIRTGAQRKNCMGKRLGVCV